MICDKIIEVILDFPIGAHRVLNQRSTAWFELHLIFTSEDPRKDGYKGDVIRGVKLHYDFDAVHAWPDGAASPDACVGQDPENPKCYKVFRYVSDLEKAWLRKDPALRDFCELVGLR